MSDDAPPSKPAEPSAPKSSKALMGILLLNLVGTGLVAFKLMTAPPVAAAAPAPHAAAEPATAEVVGPVVALDPFVVNLDEPGISRYLKVTLQLELAPKSEEALEKSKQLVRDAILNHLAGLHLKDTLGTEARDKLRQELSAKLTKLLGPDRIRRIFFQDFVVQ